MDELTRHSRIDPLVILKYLKAKGIDSPYPSPIFKAIELAALDS